MYKFPSVFYALFFRFVHLVIINSTIMSADLNVTKQFFDLKDLEEYFIHDIPSNPTTLENLMLKGEKPEIWKTGSKTVGEFMAKFWSKTSLSNVPDAERESFLGNFTTSKSKLLTWLNKSAIDEESILAVLSEKQRQHADAIGLRRKADAARQLLKMNDCVTLQTLTSDCIIIDSNGKTKIPSKNDYTVGPSSLDAAIFLADMIINYYQMQTKHVEHSVQYKVVDVCNDFGQSFDETAGKVKTHYQATTFWKDVSLLTGWEILRRCHSLDRVKILAEENKYGGTADCMEAGLRLIGNDRISCVNFLLVVALMLAF